MTSPAPTPDADPTQAYIAVRNFERFQHYKNRTPPWIKLYNDLLDDYQFARLQDASKLHLVMIWLLASRYENRIPADPEWIARRINATDPVDLRPLVSAGFITVFVDDSDTLADCKQVAIPEREGEREKDAASHQLSAAGEDADDDDIDPGATPGSPATAATPPPAPAATPDDLEAAISRVIVAANHAMTRNPAIDQARLRPIPTTGAGRQDVLDWIREGIPIEVIVRQVETVALRYRPDATNRQISTMSYFTAAIREAAALNNAKEAGGDGDGDHGRSAQAKGRGKAAGAGAGRRPGSGRRRKFEHE